MISSVLARISGTFRRQNTQAVIKGDPDLPRAKRRVWVASLWVCVAFFAVSDARAQFDHEVLGKFNEWQAVTYTEDGVRVCSMQSRPIRHLEGGKRRGEIIFFVTHRPEKNHRNVASILLGYPHAEDVDVKVEIGGEIFAFESEGEVAFSYQEQANRLVTAMREGSRMVARGLSRRGTATTDTYSLSGFTAAHRQINEACNVDG